MSILRTAPARSAIIATAITLAGNAAIANITIVPTFDSTITSDPNASQIIATINQTIQIYQADLADNISVTIKFQEMTSGLGQSNWWYYNIPYAQYRTALGADATTATDATALSHLPNVSTNPVNGSSLMSVKTANLRAVGITGLNSGLPGGVDGIIGLNTSLMNYTRPPGNPGKYDLMAVTMHEIDEVLGLASALDGIPNPLPQDLFRFDSSGNRAYTTAGDNAYFSIDGSNLLARFNQASGGDHGDWWSTGAHTPQVQDAFATPGATPNLGVELTALDAIGYNVVPAPGAASLLALAGLSACRRRRSR